MALTDNLLHYWNLDSLPWSDSAGNWNLTEQGSGTTLQTGQGPGGKNCVRLNGSGYLDRTDVAWDGATGARSYQAWAKVSSISVVGNWLLSHRTDPSPDRIGQLYRGSGYLVPDSLRAHIFDSTTNVGLGNSDYANDIWVHVVATTNGVDDHRFYVNGVLNDSSTTALGVLSTGPAPFAIGTAGWIKTGTGSANFRHIGDLALVGAWGRQLTAQEVTDLYNSGNGLSYAELFAPPAGGGIAVLELDASGGGTTTRSGGGTAELELDATGGGQAPVVTPATGGGTAVLELDATGGGFVTRSGGGLAALILEATGGGTTTRSGGGTAELELDATGGGLAPPSAEGAGGGTAELELDATGGGFVVRSGGAVAVLLLDATGQGPDLPPAEADNMLQRAAGWLHGKRQTHFSILVAYQRGGTGPVKMIRATPVRTQTDQLLEADLQISGSLRDWIFRTVDFLDSGAVDPPKRRDVFTDPGGQQWEVVDLAGDPVWRYSDDYQNAIRLHAVSNTAAS